MICHRCLARAARRSQLSPVFFNGPSRIFAATTSRRAQSSTATTSTAAATSQSVAQPFSAGTAPDVLAVPKAPAKVKRPPSSVPAGAPLKGINFMKGQQDPIAKEDHEYPDWLWTVLDRKASEKDDLGAEGDLFSKSKKQRRAAAKELRKRQLLNPDSMLPKIPLYEQSIDLDAGDGTVEGAKQAAAARRDLTKAMRENRRSKIKEANFLKAMG